MPVTPGSSKPFTAAALAAMLAAGIATAVFTTLTATNLILTEQSTPPLSGAGQAKVYADSTAHNLQVSQNGGAYTAIGGGGTPGGANTQVQFNNAGAFGGDSDLTFATDTLTATKVSGRVIARVQSVADAATITPNADTDDAVDITAIAQAFTIANPTGTPVNFQRLTIRVKDNATARAITWGANFVSGGATLPTTTVISKILTVSFIYNTANALNKWQCVSVAQEL